MTEIFLPDTFDATDYAADFAARVVPAYQSGTGDAGLPADDGLARSLIPPGTAAVRDFSTLSPRIPQFIAEKGCVASRPPLARRT